MTELAPDESCPKHFLRKLRNLGLAGISAQVKYRKTERGENCQWRHGNKERKLRLKKFSQNEREKSNHYICQMNES